MERKEQVVPVIQPWTKTFWEGTRQGKLLIQHCRECDANIFFPKKFCPECWSGSLVWNESGGKGVVYTYTIMRDLVSPVFMGDLPYVLAMVDLEEGIRMTTRIVNCRPEDVSIGMEVEVQFKTVSTDFSLPVFQPRDTSLQMVAKEEQDFENTVMSEAGAEGRGEGYRTIDVAISGKGASVCTITLNRPEKFNAINRKMAKELIDAFQWVRDVPTVGVVVLTGAGKAFCTGGDLEIFPSLAQHQNSLNWLAHEGLDVQRAISSCEKVVIGKINGHCVAGGLELALACDLLYATASARMGMTEINMGVLPGWGGTARLPRSMPIFRAREVIFSGKKDYTAQEMYEMGMLTRVFPDELFEEQFQNVVNNIASKKPIALRIGKEVMARSIDGCDIETALAVERNGIQWLTYAPDIQQMMDQFRSSPGQLTQSQKKSNIQADR